MAHLLEVCGLLLLSQVHHITCGNVSIGPVEVKTFSTFECISADDIKLEFIRITANKERQTIAQCLTSIKACHLVNQTLGKYYAASYTGNGAIFNVMNDVEETRGTYYCCNTFPPIKCDHLEINHRLRNDTNNQKPDGHDSNKETVSSTHPQWVEKAVIGLVVFFAIFAVVGVIVAFKFFKPKECSRTSMCSRCSQMRKNSGKKKQTPTAEKDGGDEEEDTLIGDEICKMEHSRTCDEKMREDKAEMHILTCFEKVDERQKMNDLDVDDLTRRLSSTGNVIRQVRTPADSGFSTPKKILSQSMSVLMDVKM